MRVILVLLALVSAAYAARQTTELKGRSLGQTRQLFLVQASSTPGWWGAIQADGDDFCGLRNFPPIPDGYGTARMLCGGYTSEYDHYWAWRIISVEDEDKAYPSLTVPNGAQVYMEILVPMLPWCGLTGSKQVKCGYADSKRTTFIVERAGAGEGDLNLANESFYMKSATGGDNSYCSTRGSGSSTYVYCASDAAHATVWSYKLSTYYSMSISSVKVSGDSDDDLCGFNFIPLAYEQSAVNCTTQAPYIPSNYADNFFVSLQIPGGMDGAPLAPISGSNMTFKAHDSLYKYQVSTWKVDSASKKVVAEENDSNQPGQWFTITALDAGDGAVLEDGMIVTIKSAKYGTWCTPSPQIVCNRATAPTADDTDYLFMVHIDAEEDDSEEDDK